MMKLPKDQLIAATSSESRAWLAGLALGVSCVVLIAFRLHAFDLPLENDECNYAYIGGRLLAGDRLYSDLWDHQPFGVFALFAAVISVFGDAPEVFRCMTMAFSLASLVLIFGIVRRVAGPAAAVSAAVLFAMASSDPGTAGEGCNREIYMITLILASWYFALRGGGRRGWWLFGAGVSLGLASTIKTIVAVHWLFLCVWALVVTYNGADLKL
jgi:dolichyl-phosphate-mannose--protein O-mannosyl transferase